MSNKENKKVEHRSSYSRFRTFLNTITLLTFSLCLCHCVYRRRRPETNPHQRLPLIANGFREWSGQLAGARWRRGCRMLWKYKLRRDEIFWKRGRRVTVASNIEDLGFWKTKVLNLEPSKLFKKCFKMVFFAITHNFRCWTWKCSFLHCFYTRQARFQNMAPAWKLASSHHLRAFFWTFF